MHTKRPDEFHITIRWQPGYHGGMKPNGIPGFYVKAGWANEGEAFYPVDDLRVPAHSAVFHRVLQTLDDAFLMDGSLVAQVGPIRDAHDKAASAHAGRLRTRVHALRQQLAEAEAAASSIERQA